MQGRWTDATLNSFIKNCDFDYANEYLFIIIIAVIYFDYMQ